MGGKNGNDASVSMQKTAKFSVLDAPGITQPEINDKAPITTCTPKGTFAKSAPAAAEKKEGSQGRRATAESGPRMESSLIGGSSFTKREKNPEWLQARVDVFDKVAERRAEELKAKNPVAIKVTLPDGKVLEQNKEGASYLSWKTSPYDVAATISQGLADSAVVARVTYESYVEDYNLSQDGMDGVDVMEDDLDLEVDAERDAKALLWDMTRPLVGNVAKLEFLKYENDSDAKTVFWHSSAHMLGETMEHLYGSRLTIGPPLRSGFYYDSFMGSEAFNEDDCKLKLNLLLEICNICKSFLPLLT